jgi:peroxiredoxin
LETLWRKYRGQGVAVVAVEAVGDRERAVKFIGEKKLSFALLENDESNDVVRDKYGVRSFPTSFMIDREGKIIYCHVGFEPGDEEKLEKEIVELKDR